MRLFRIFRKHLILGIVIIALMILIFGYLFFFLVGPIMLVGPPCSLYYIDNKSTENHTIIVEIFDENNLSVLKKTYTLLPGGEVSYERRIGWEPKITWGLITWSDGIYTFHFNVDNKYSEWYTTGVSPFCSLNIWLFFKDKRTNETIPIDIKKSCV